MRVFVFATAAALSLVLQACSSADEATTSPSETTTTTAPEASSMSVDLFDWDDNILTMPTVNYAVVDGVPRNITSAEYRDMKANGSAFEPLDGDYDVMFTETTDVDWMAGHPEWSYFFNHTMQAMLDEWRKAPAFDKFVRTFNEGRPFAIITARQHFEETVRHTSRTVLAGDRFSVADKESMLANARKSAMLDGDMTDAEVLDWYFGVSRFFNVNSQWFKDEIMGGEHEGTAGNKREGLRWFVSREVQRISQLRNAPEGLKFKFAFSDDDPENVHSMSEFISTELAAEFPGVRFCIYDTSKGDWDLHLDEESPTAARTLYDAVLNIRNSRFLRGSETVTAVVANCVDEETGDRMMLCALRHG